MNGIPNAAPAGGALRPLGIGEILDRAVNLCVKHFLPLSLIYVVFMIPFSFVQYYATKDLSAMLQAFASASQSAGSNADPSAVLRHLNTGSTASPGVLLMGFVLLLLSPLPAGALIEATSCFYFGRPTSFSQAYRAGWACYLQLLGVTVLFFVAGGLLYLGFTLVVVALAFAIGFIYAQLIPGLGIALGIIAGIAVLAAILAVVLFATLALQLSYVMCVVERANFAVAFSRSFGRLSSGVGLRRAAIVGFAYLAITLGIGLVALLGQLAILSISQSAVGGAAYEAVVRVISSAFTTAFIVIFYYDLRVREEGLDLQIEALAVRDEPATAAPVPAVAEPPPFA